MREVTSEITDITVEKNRVGNWDCIYYIVDYQYEQNPQTYIQDFEFDTKEEAVAEAKRLYDEFVTAGHRPRLVLEGL
jgi:hypothetical protein